VADFDPHAFLAGGDSFDPEQFASENPETPEETALRESFLDTGKFKPSPAHRRFNNTGRIDQVRAELDPAQVPDPSLGEAVSSSLNSGLDRFTLGAYGGLLRAGRALGVPTTGQAVEGMERFRQEAPTTEGLATAPVYALEGPANLLTQAASNAIGRGLTAIPGGAQMLESIPGRVFQAAGTSGLASSAMGGLQAFSEGASPEEALQAAKESGETGLALGAGLGVGTGLMSEAGRGIRQSRGGQARQFIEERGGNVGLTSPGRGRPYDEMVASRGPDALAATDENIGQQASESARTGLNMLNTEDRAIKGAIGRGMGRIYESPAAGELHDVTNVVTSLEDAANDIGISPVARQALRDELAAIRSRQGQGFNPEVDNYFLSEGDLNGLKRSLDRYARTGQSTDEKFSPIRRAADDVRTLVNEGPFADANAQYAQQAQNNQLDRRLLGIPERQRTPNALEDVEGELASGDSRTAEDVVKNRIMRRGQNTVTAGGQRTDMERFAERHPDVGAEFDKPELLRKRGDISFRLLPQRHGGLIERTGSGLGSLGVLEAAAHALGHGHTGFGGALAAGAGGLALQNLPAIQARLLYGPALAAQAAAPLVLGELPLLTAARAAQTEGR